MSSEYRTGMTILTSSTSKSASGFVTTTFVEGIKVGAKLSTINPLTSRINSEVPLDGTLLIAETRESTNTQAIELGSYVRIDGDDYLVNGISKGNYGRFTITFNLRKVTEVA